MAKILEHWHLSILERLRKVSLGEELQVQRSRGGRVSAAGKVAKGSE